LLAAGTILLLLLFVRGQGSKGHDLCLAVFSMSLLGLILLDQHRLQPWAYQFLLIALILTNLSPQKAIVWLRLLTISIYVHSAISKLDLSFWDGLGASYLQSLLGNMGIAVDGWPLPARRLAVALLPVGELIIAVGLWRWRSRWWALVGAVVMHLVMLICLGPW